MLVLAVKQGFLICLWMNSWSTGIHPTRSSISSLYSNNYGTIT